MVQNIFKGLGIALITPFKEDGSVDYDALKRLVQYQLDNGADFFCILATTGETPTLTAEEKKRIKDLVVEVVKGKVKEADFLLPDGYETLGEEELKELFEQLQEEIELLQGE